MKVLNMKRGKKDSDFDIADALKQVALKNISLPKQSAAFLWVSESINIMHLRNR